jgi:hypothetical protein
VSSSDVLSVKSSLPGHVTLAHRIRWTATPSVPPDQISEVDFLIDGKQLWIEPNAPYDYGDDGNFLVTSFLSAGPHTFTVKATTAAGKTASTTVTANVLVQPEHAGRLQATCKGRRTASAAMSIQEGAAMRKLALAAAVAALVPTIVGCGSRGAGRPANRSSLHVISSITDRAVLSDPVRWTAQPVGMPSGDGVARVEFLIDGRLVWTEHGAPYFFNDDYNHLYPWVLGTGQHHLAIRLVTVYGRSASTTAQVTVRSGPAATLHGNYVRRVTATDVQRTQALRNEPADQTPPAGTWRLHVAADGVFFFDDPQGGGGSEAFAALPHGTLTMEGPVNWLEPTRRQGSFCGVEPSGAYRWALHGTTLTLAVRRDRCADRNSIFTGTWTRA